MAMRILLGLCLLLPSLLNATQSSPSKPNQFAVASAHHLATEAGIKTLEQGGNAFDAAITVAAVLGVVEPYSAGIGGGGFWLLHQNQPNQGRTIMLDARERAPAAAHADLYLDDNGQVDRDLAINTGLSAGIPGQAAAFVHLAQYYGKRSLAANLKPAIKLAKKGFPSNAVYTRLAGWRKDVLARYPASAEVFLSNGDPITEGTPIIQKDLAKTLTALAKQGFAGFYQGPIAHQLVAGVNAAGGNWQLADLANYRVIERQPIQFQFGDATIWSAAPPSSGGLVLAQLFGMLEHFPTLDSHQPEHIHLLVEMMRRAYRDRAEHLGDPDFVSIPTAKLTSETYLAALAKSIDPDQATASSSLGPPLDQERGNHTTHFSIIDREGNQVAATLSINLPFGSGVVAPGTGILLNNEMDDFSAKPGSPNAFGLVGSQANAIAPGKRPLSSMTPTMMEFGAPDDRYRAILGTPGGSRIITMVFLGMLEALAEKPP